MYTLPQATPQALKPGCKPDNWLDNKASWLAGYWLAGLGAAANARQLAGTSWQVPKPITS